MFCFRLKPESSNHPLPVLQLYFLLYVSFQSGHLQFCPSISYQSLSVSVIFSPFKHLLSIPNHSLCAVYRFFDSVDFLTPHFQTLSTQFTTFENFNIYNIHNINLILRLCGAEPNSLLLSANCRNQPTCLHVRSIDLLVPVPRSSSIPNDNHEKVDLVSLNIIKTSDGVWHCLRLDPLQLLFRGCQVSLVNEPSPFESVEITLNHSPRFYTCAHHISNSLMTVCLIHPIKYTLFPMKPFSIVT